MIRSDAADFEDRVRQAVVEPVQFHTPVDRSVTSFKPPIDIKETDLEQEIFIDLPGVDEDELEFCWSEGSLCISGTRDFNHDVEDAEEFIQIQRTFGAFRCQIPLNPLLDVSRTTAKYRRGVLKIRIPKIRPHREPSTSDPTMKELQPKVCDRTGCSDLDCKHRSGSQD